MKGARGKVEEGRKGKHTYNDHSFVTIITPIIPTSTAHNHILVPYFSPRFEYTALVTKWIRMMSRGRRRKRAISIGTPTATFTTESATIVQNTIPILLHFNLLLISSSYSLFEDDLDDCSIFLFLFRPLLALLLFLSFLLSPISIQHFLTSVSLSEAMYTPERQERNWRNEKKNPTSLQREKERERRRWTRFFFSLLFLAPPPEYGSILLLIVFHISWRVQNTEKRQDSMRWYREKCTFSLGAERMAFFLASITYLRCPYL